MDYKILNKVLNIAESKESRECKLEKLNELFASNYRTDKNHSKRLLGFRDLVFNYYGFTGEIAKIRIQLPEYIHPKQVYCYLVFEHYKEQLGNPSLGVVASTLGLLCHATVKNSIKKITGYLENDQTLNNDIVKIRREIENKFFKEF